MDLGHTAQPISPPDTYFGVLFRGRTYRRLLYLLLSLPLSIVYSTAVIVGIGFAPLLLGLTFVWWALAAGERGLVSRLIGIAITPPPRPQGRGAELVVGMLRSPSTWRAATYLVLSLPFSAVAFTLTVTLLTVSLAFALQPPLYLVATHLWPLPDGAGVQFAVPFVRPIPVTGTVSPAALAWLVLYALAALVLLPLGLRLLDGLAAGWGRLARWLLSESALEQRLRAAEAAAERERANAERADRTRRELIVNVSHELRTPVALIAGHLESLLMAGRDGAQAHVSPEQSREYLEIAHRETQRLAALIDDLLSLARADAGELRLDLGPVQAATVVEEVCRGLAPLAKRERQVTLVWDADPALPPVIADRARLAQVLLNLLRNAVTHTPEGGLVSVTLRAADPGHLELAVADTGAGIPPEDLERVFERFYRTDASRSRASGGFGLGLAIVRDLVTAMRGTITAENTPGQGSTFRLRLVAEVPR